MKYLFFLLFFLFLFSLIKAQKDIYTFGKISIEDLQMKECSFDKEAEAMVLFDIGQNYCYANTWNTDFEKHKRIKIFNQNGITEATIKIYFSSIKRLGQIRKLEAQTYNLDAANNIIISKVEKAAIYEKKLDNRISQITFTFPEVKPGSIIEFKYVHEYNNLRLKDWDFQENIPVLHSQYSLDFPNELEVDAISTGPLYPIKTEKNKGSRTITTYTLDKAFALKTEPYITAYNDYTTSINTSLRAYNPPQGLRRDFNVNWPTIIYELMEDIDFGIQIKKEIPRTKDLDDSLKNITDDFKKLTTIHEYVRKNMVWDNTFSIWALEGVKHAWKEKKGTAGEINLILINLLKDAHLDARPVLVSTRKNGLVNPAIVDYMQFDKVMAYVVINKKVYVLDATDKLTPSHLIPPDVNFSEGIVITKLEKSGWGWIRLWNANDIAENIIAINASIDNTDSIKGNASIFSKNYSKLERLNIWKTSIPDFEKRYFTPLPLGLKMTKIEYENENKDSLAFIQKINYTHKLNTAGEYAYFSLNSFSDLEKNPFTNENRYSDIYYGQNQKITLTGNFDIGKNYSIQELPKNLKMIMPDTSIVFSRLLNFEDNMLSYRITIEYKQPFYPPSEYPYIYEFHKSIYQLLEEQVVIKKK